MNLKRVNPNKIKFRFRSKQEEIRDILNQFKQSDMMCAEIENWDEISDTLEEFRQMVKNQISYRNGKVYEHIKVITRTNDGFKVYLLKEEDE